MSYADSYAGASSTAMTFPESKFQLRYGNITYEILQDIELAVIAMKELKYMLSSHYRCYFDTSTTLDDQIHEFLDTQYHKSVVDPVVKTRLCAVMKGLVHERNLIAHTEGIDFLRDRSKFINQSMEIFVNLSPTENGICVSPARHSVLVPCPNSQSLFEDLTFIDYEQYEDISIAIKVTKRIDHILREVFQQRGESLQRKIDSFPFDANNIKRKMSQVNAIRNKIIHERYFNNFDNRVEFINLARSIFANLIEIVDSGKIYKFGGEIGGNLDVLSNTTDDNNMTSADAATTVSTYHIPAHAPAAHAQAAHASAAYSYPHSTPLSPPVASRNYNPGPLSPPVNRGYNPLSPPVNRGFNNPLSPPVANRGFNNPLSPPFARGGFNNSIARSWATSGNYEKLPSFRDDSTIPVDAVALQMREYNKQAGRYLPSHEPSSVPTTRYEHIPSVVEHQGRLRERRHGRYKRENKKMMSCCKNSCIAFTIAAFMGALIFLCWKFLF